MGAEMDIRIAGIHSLCWKGGTRDQNTQGMIAAIQNPWVKVISHPGDGTAELDFEPIVKAAAEAHTLLEINSSSLKPCRHKYEARDNNLVRGHRDRFPVPFTKLLQILLFLIISHMIGGRNTLFLLILIGRDPSLRSG